VRRGVVLEAEVAHAHQRGDHEQDHDRVARGAVGERGRAGAEEARPQLPVPDRDEDELVDGERERHAGQQHLDLGDVPAREPFDEILHRCD